jgi:hypothetical protein
MLQPVLGYSYWYFIADIPKLTASARELEGCTMRALPVLDCGLVFRLDRVSLQLRVQFRIQKGNYNTLVQELHRLYQHVNNERERLLGKWIVDEINDIATWLLIVAVEINTENLAAFSKSSSSKKQELYQAKVYYTAEFYYIILLNCFFTFSFFQIFYLNFIYLARCIRSFTICNTLCTQSRRAGVSNGPGTCPKESTWGALGTRYIQEYRNF